MRAMTLSLFLTLAACHSMGADQHTSATSLDWAGVYYGVVPCADCEGIETTLKLSTDGDYELSMKYLGSFSAPYNSTGAFEWWKAGRAIKLKTRDGTPRSYRVEENRLRQLDTRGELIEGTLADRYVLRKVGSDSKSGLTTLTGTATYKERMALPEQAVFEAALEDVSRADVPAEILGTVRVENPGSPPIKFGIAYEPMRIDPRHRYVVRARIVVADALLFTTDTSYPVLTGGNPLEANLVLRRGHAGAPVPPAPTATLENTYWKLIRLGAAAVVVGESQREPHLILHPDNNRVSGSGGCNRLTGTYTLEGNRLTFAQIAGTMMACPSGMDQERSFHDALGLAATWRVEGERLELFDASGKAIARFESRYLN
jgi:putative lipoprotein